MLALSKFFLVIIFKRSAFWRQRLISLIHTLSHNVTLLPLLINILRRRIFYSSRRRSLIVAFLV
jgi:hypothetical protein